MRAGSPRGRGWVSRSAGWRPRCTSARSRSMSRREAARRSRSACRSRSVPVEAEQDREVGRLDLVAVDVVARRRQAQLQVEREVVALHELDAAGDEAGDAGVALVLVAEFVDGRQLTDAEATLEP